MPDEDRKPCPFCGGAISRVEKEPRFPPSAMDGPDAWAYTVVCNSCAAVGPWHKSATSAVRGWNMRAQPSPFGPNIDAILAAVRARVSEGTEVLVEQRHSMVEFFLRDLGPVQLDSLVVAFTTREINMVRDRQWIVDRIVTAWETEAARPAST